MSTRVPLSTVAIRREPDLLLVRQRARTISQFLGFTTGDTTRISTAVSEVARNAFEYGGGGTATFSVESNGGTVQELVIRIADEGPGIANIDDVLAIDFKSTHGLGLGIKGSRALMDRFEIASEKGSGTSVVMGKAMPRTPSPFGPADAARIAADLTRAGEASPLGELQVQNQALLVALEELTQRQAEIERLGAVAAEARDRAEAAQLVAERSLVVRERFMALTTHELRTPLGAIVGYLDLLDMEIADSISDRQKEFFSRVQRAAKHMLGVTNDFLDMAQGDAGRLKVARHAGAARQVMSEAYALIDPQASARNVAVHLAETSDHVMYLGDSDRVRQVLVNLLGNAVSFTPLGGSVYVVASRVADAPPGSALTGGPWCVIRVEDTGPGIPADKLSHVFEPFVQLTSDGQTTRKGSGLGLTVSRQLALLMGGDLIVESGGAGAVFELWLVAGDRDTE